MASGDSAAGSRTDPAFRPLARRGRMLSHWHGGRLVAGRRGGAEATCWGQRTRRQGWESRRERSWWEQMMWAVMGSKVHLVFTLHKSIYEPPGLTRAIVRARTWRPPHLASSSAPATTPRCSYMSLQQQILSVSLKEKLPQHVKKTKLMTSDTCNIDWN
jgi:hypothetical protein